jgi:hypothetical protein
MFTMDCLFHTFLGQEDIIHNIPPCHESGLVRSDHLRYEFLKVYCQNLVHTVEKRYRVLVIGR